MTIHTEQCTLTHDNHATTVKTIDVYHDESRTIQNSSMTHIVFGGVTLSLNRNDAYALASRILQTIGRSVIVS